MIRKFHELEYILWTIINNIVAKKNEKQSVSQLPCCHFIFPNFWSEQKHSEQFSSEQAMK